MGAGELTEEEKNSALGPALIFRARRETNEWNKDQSKKKYQGQKIFKAGQHIT